MKRKDMITQRQAAALKETLSHRDIFITDDYVKDIIDKHTRKPYVFKEGDTVRRRNKGYVKREGYSKKHSDVEPEPVKELKYSPGEWIIWDGFIKHNLCLDDFLETQKEVIKNTHGLFFDYQIKLDDGTTWWVDEEHLAPLPEVKPGDFVIGKNKKIYCLGDAIKTGGYGGYNFDAFKCSQSPNWNNKCYEVYLKDINHIATDADWIVDKKGVQWRAEVYVNDRRIHLSLKGAAVAHAVLHNKAMKQLCAAMGIPIKPCEGE